MSETTQFDDPPSLTQENFKQWVKSKGYKNEEETENSWNVLVEKKIVDNGIVLKSFLENLSTSDFTSYGINPVISGFLFGWSHKAPAQQQVISQQDPLSKITTTLETLTFNTPFKPTYFTLKKDHPFSSTCPKDLPYNTKTDGPDLLYWNLPFSTSSFLPAVNQALAMYDEGKIPLAVFLGPSGCGKTRSLYELLCNTRGFYLVAGTQGNAGSKALFKCVNNIKQRISYSNKDATKNDEIARFHFFALLYSYLKIHNFFRNLSNEMWFWLQIYPKSIHSNGEDIFEKIYDLVSDLCKDMSLSDLIKKEINKYKEICGGKKPIVALDEIHILGSGEIVYSAPTSIGEFRALFSRIIYEFCKMEIFTVAAGTSLRLKDALSVAVSAVGKLNVDVNEYLIVNFGGLFTFRDLKDYFFQFFGKPDPKSSVGWTEKTISRIYRFLQGRFRFCSSFIELILMNEDSFNILTVLDNWMKVIAESDNTISLQNEINKAASNSSIMDTFRKLLLTYFNFGCVFLREGPSLEIVDYSLCFLEEDQDFKLVPHICEPLVAKAGYFYFQKIKKPLDLEYFNAISSTPSAPACGFIFEGLILNRTLEYFRKYNYIGELPLLKGVNLKKAAWANQTSFILKHSKERMSPWFKQSDSASFNQDLVQWREELDVDVVISPFNNKAHDAIFGAQDSFGFLHLVVAQWKFRMNETTKKISDIAQQIIPYSLTNTFQRKFFTKRFTSGFIGVIFLFDTSLVSMDDLNSIRDVELEQGNILLFLTPNTAPELFSKKEWKLLHTVKVIHNPKKRKWTRTTSRSRKKRRIIGEESDDPDYNPDEESE